MKPSTHPHAVKVDPITLRFSPVWSSGRKCMGLLASVLQLPVVSQIMHSVAYVQVHHNA